MFCSWSFVPWAQQPLWIFVPPASLMMAQWWLSLFFILLLLIGILLQGRVVCSPPLFVHSFIYINMDLTGYVFFDRLKSNTTIILLLQSFQLWPLWDVLGWLHYILTEECMHMHMHTHTHTSIFIFVSLNSYWNLRCQSSTIGSLL